MEYISTMFGRYQPSFSMISKLIDAINNLNIDCKMYINPIKSLQKINNNYIIQDEELEYHYIVLVSFENRKLVKELIDDHVKKYDALIDDEFEPNIYYLIIGDVEIRISLIVDLPNSLDYIMETDTLMYELNADNYVMMEENNMSLENKLIPYKTKIREFELMKQYGIFE